MLAGLMSPCTTPRLVAVVQRRQHLVHQPRHLAEREALAAVQQVFQVAALDQLHGDPGCLGVLAVIIDGDDVGVVEPAGRLRLALEAGHRLLALAVAGFGPADRLQRRAALDHRVERVMDSAHGAGAELAADHVLAEHLSGHGASLDHRDGPAFVARLIHRLWRTMRGRDSDIARASPPAALPRGRVDRGPHGQCEVARAARARRLRAENMRPTSC